MKTQAIVLLGIALLATAAHATDGNLVGFYFEPSAQSNCVESQPYATIPLYLVLTEPDIDAVYGFEFGFDITGSYLLQGVQFSGTGAIDVGGGQGNHIVGLAQPLRVSGPTVLSTLQVFVLDSNQIRFDLHGSDPASLADHPNQPALLVDGSAIITAPLAVAANLPSARINGKCNPDTDPSTWDTVKSMYH